MSIETVLSLQFLRREWHDHLYQNFNFRKFFQKNKKCPPAPLKNKVTKNSPRTITANLREKHKESLSAKDF